MILLIHHGEAVGPEIDAMRPLSDRGRAATRLLAFEAAKNGVHPDGVWHSGKLRARQTAELYWRACNPFAAFSAERGLQPNDPPDWMRDRLLGETRAIMLVGHMPNIARLLRLLLGEDVDSSPVTFPLNGCVALEAKGEGWTEVWRLGRET